MTTFTITGQRHDGNGGTTEYTVTWTDGELSGDESAVKDVLRLALALDGKPVRSIVTVPTYDWRDHLKNPYSACTLMRMIFISRTTTQIGSLPKIKLPPGAIA